MQATTARPIYKVGDDGMNGKGIVFSIHWAKLYVVHEFPLSESRENLMFAGCQICRSAAEICYS